MNTYRIFYVRPERFASLASRMFVDGSFPNPADYEEVTTLKASRLEAAWTKMNAVRGDEKVAKLGIRSMMLGDVALDVSSGKAFACSMVGWTELSPELFRQFATKVSSTKE